MTDEQKILSMRHNGATQREIAKDTGLELCKVRKVLLEHPEVKKVRHYQCKVCRKLVRCEKQGILPKTCGSEECNKEWQRRVNKVWREKYKKKRLANSDGGPVRQYTSASDRMIRDDLKNGRPVGWMAQLYRRDRNDLKKHIAILKEEDKAAEYGIRRVDNKLANEIIKGRYPRGRFYTIDKGKYIGIDNETRDAWTEEFENFDQCLGWLKNQEEELSR